jgi:sporulation protein YlmC with PRC-barrel domain
MQTYVTLIRAGALVGGLLALGPVRAPIPLDPPVTTPLVRAVASLDAVAHPLQSPPVFATRALLGVPITTADGAQLGQLDDVLIDPTEGRITMVIVAAGGRFGLGGRFMVLPWTMLRPAADGTALVITLWPLPPQHPPAQEVPEDISLR